MITNNFYLTQQLEFSFRNMLWILSHNTKYQLEPKTNYIKDRKHHVFI